MTIRIKQRYTVLHRSKKRILKSAFQNRNCVILLCSKCSNVYNNNKVKYKGKMHNYLFSLFHFNHFTPLKNSNNKTVESSTKLPVTDLKQAPLKGMDSNFQWYKVEKSKHSENNITRLFNIMLQQFSFYTSFVSCKTTDDIKYYSNDINRCKSNSIYSDITDNSSDVNIEIENYFNCLTSTEHLEYIEDLYNYNLDDHNIISPNSELY